MNHYELLGVSEKATEQEIRKAYLKLVKKYHPDINKEVDANRLFIKIKNAYDTLSDPKLREKYNLKHGITKNFNEVNNKQRKNTLYSNKETKDKPVTSNKETRKKQVTPNKVKKNINKDKFNNIKNKIDYHYAILIFALIAFIIGAVFVRGIFDDTEESLPKEEAIESVKAAYIDDLNIEEQVNLAVENDNSVKRRIGWKCEIVSENLYFVTYNYDIDNDLSNGWISICYELDSSSQEVKKITDNIELIDKYKKLGYIE
ncbi:J domain-containing protein [Clostridium sp. DL1XJH146]